MIGTIILILIVLVVLYFLYVNNKLNFNSIAESSPSMNQSSDSLNVDPQTKQLSVKFNSPKIKSIRVLHGENSISKVFVAEKPLSYNEIIEEGNRSIGTNSVFMGVLSEPSPTATMAAATAGSSSATANRVTPNFDIKQFKNMFIIFKNIDSSKIKESLNMVRYEADGMVYCLIDATTSTVPDLREASYPIIVYTANVNVQLKLKEWNYTQLNEAGTLFLKNEKSFRLQ
uniref:Ac94 n=1 Tax=Malacosoma sp. alphabaculovirus TaxID=1881632 RepID=A0A1B1V5H9_9ABAC|nr:ac94 [Malacosoma sp. alphabaculovirus]